MTTQPANDLRGQLDAWFDRWWPHSRSGNSPRRALLALPAVTAQLDADVSAGPYQIPPRIAVDTNGYVWRIFHDPLVGEIWSMATTNPDNSPIPGPVTFYEPVADEDYCGCCGNEIDGSDANWCTRCDDHIDRRTSAYLWKQTYYAVHGEDCPFQVDR